MKFKTLLVAALSLATIQQSFGQSCASTSPNQYEWPGHRNWFIAAGNGWTGMIVNMQTFATTVAGTPGVGASAGGGAVTQYEGTSTVSDDQGNLMFYANGRRIFTGTGGSVVRTYAGLLTGNEGGATGNNGSATQGIITVRHPLNPDEFHVFTTDDANSATTVGLNHFVISPTGTLISGPTRLGTFRTTEALAATRHANGIDFWVTAVDVNGAFNAYLLKCDGMDIANSNLNQPSGPDVSSNSAGERGGLAFSWDGKKMASVQGTPTVTERVAIYDFDNSTGAITNRVNISQANVAAPYDVIFSTDNSRIYVSFIGNELLYYDISSGVQATMQTSQTTTGINCGNGAAIKIGPNGKMYIASGAPGGGYLREINENINTSLTFTTTNVAGTNGQSALGLPSMFIPPLDSAKIQPVPQQCTTGPAIDLSTLWACAGTDVEQFVPHTYTASCGACIDANTGLFDPAVAGIGQHLITFTLTNPACDPVSDTMYIDVANCNCIDPQIGSPTISVCAVDSSFDLNTAYGLDIVTYPGTWSVTPPPASSSNPLTGSNFNANGVDLGVYTVTYTLNNPGDPSCAPTSRQITVANCCPAVAINPSVSICVGETTDLSTQVTAGTGTFNITNGPGGTASVNPATGIFTSDPNVSGTYTVTFTTSVLGCVENDAIDVTVNPYPIANITTDASAICAGQTANLTATSSIGSGVTFTWNDLSTGSTKAVTSPGTYTVTAAIGSCTHDTSIVIGTNPSPSATLPGDTTICTLRGEKYTATVTHTAGANASITWSSIGSAGDQSVTISSTPTIVVVTVTDPTGCIASDSLEVTEYCIPPEFEVPNVFNPGGDNPTWTPYGNIVPADVSNSRLEVYDRWGLKMYESTETLPVWDGTNNNRKCSSGVYFWIWTYTETTTGSKKSMNGFVHLINQK